MTTQVKGRLGDRLIEGGLCTQRDVDVARTVLGEHES